jgi:hypothetical protein
MTLPKGDDSMTVTLVPKDSVGQRLTLKNIVCWYHSHNAFTFVDSEGMSRTYPDVHIWYVEQFLALE